MNAPVHRTWQTEGRTARHSCVRHSNRKDEERLTSRVSRATSSLFTLSRSPTVIQQQKLQAHRLPPSFSFSLSLSLSRCRTPYQSIFKKDQFTPEISTTVQLASAHDDVCTVPTLTEVTFVDSVINVAHSFSVVQPHENTRTTTNKKLCSNNC